MGFVLSSSIFVFVSDFLPDRPQQRQRIEFYSPGEAKKLDDIDPPLASLNFGHIRLWYAQTVGHGMLGELRITPRGDEASNHFLVERIVNRLGQCARGSLDE